MVLADIVVNSLYEPRKFAGLFVVMLPQSRRDRTTVLVPQDYDQVGVEMFYRILNTGNDVFIDNVACDSNNEEISQPFIKDQFRAYA